MNSKMKKTIGFVFTCIILSGCQTISPQECKSANWYDKGILDGSNGLKPTILVDYKNECAEAGVAVNSADWQEGYKHGLTTYCTPENGYFVGSKGLTYRSVCSSQKFLENYRLGKEDYQREQRRKEITDEINQLKGESVKESDKSKQKHLRERIEKLEDDLNTLNKPSVSFEINF